MNEWQIQLEEDLNGTADQDLGTIVAVCDGTGRYDDGSLLEVCELRYHVADDNWTPQIVTADLMVDPLLLTTVQDSDVAEYLLDTLKQIHDGETLSIHSVAIRPKRVPPSWRQGRIEARLSDLGPNNQASYRTLPENHPRKDRLKFHTDGELRMWAWPALTDIPHQGHRSGEDVHHGDHGTQAASGASVVHA